MRFLLLILLTAISLHALELGAKAPPLAGVTWVKGDPVTLGRGITVVEFWATWCGPCKTSIPHLTKLAHRFSGKVAIVGLSDEDAATVKPFVASQGAQMDYHVGLVDEATHAAYMQGVQGIPFAFIVNAEGTVVWKGHPMAMDRVVTALANGTFDLVKEARRGTLSAELQALTRSDPGADEAGLIRKVLAKTGEILELDPADQEAIELRIAIAKMQDQPGLVRDTVQAIPLASLTADQAASLALRLIQEEAITLRAPDLAIALADRAVAADPAAAEGHAARAVVLQALGLADAALASQEVAAKADPVAQSAMLAYLTELKRLRTQIQAGTPVTAPAPPAKKAEKPSLPATITP